MHERAVGQGSERRGGGIRSPGRRPVVLAAIAAGVAIVVPVGVFALSRGSGLDPVARADEALAPNGSIIHMRLTLEASAGGRAAAPQTIEVWSADYPRRSRIVQKVPDEDGARREFAYIQGTAQDYNPRRDSLTVLTDGAASEQVPSVVPLDPGRDIRPMIERGELHDRGERMIHGRKIHQFVGEMTAPGSTRRRLAYNVDARTFEPVGGELRIVVGSRRDTLAGPRDPLTVRIKYGIDLYERISDAPVHEHLLRIQITPQTKVTKLTVEELRERQRRPVQARHRQQRAP